MAKLADAPRSRRLLSGFAAGYANMAVMTACSLIAVPFYVRYLGKEQYGIWLVILSFLGPLSVSQLGFPTVTQNMLAEARAKGEWERVNGVLATGSGLLTVSILLGCGAFAAATFTGVVGRILKMSHSLAGGLGLVVLIMVCGYALAAPLQVFRLAFRAFEKVDVEQSWAAVFAIVNLLLVVATLAAGGGLVAVAFCVSLTPVLAGGFYFLHLRKTFPHCSFSPRLFSKSLARSMLLPGFNFFLLSVSGMLIWGLDNIVISGVVGVVFVAAFAIAWRLMSLLRGLFSVVCNTLAPTITALRSQEDHEILKRVVLLASKLSMAAAIIFGVELLFFGRDFIRLWAGKQVVLDPTTFSILLAILAINVLCMPGYYVVVATSQHKTYAWLALFEGLLNVLLSYWWAHRWGVAGVALGTLVSDLLISAWYLPLAGWRISRVAFPDVLKRSIFPLLPAGAVALFAAYATRSYVANWLELGLAISTTFAAFLVSYSIFAAGREEQRLLSRLSPRLAQRIVASES